ncbi:hypothetical protein [Sanguibacter sp. 25GB23B1]|uniref:hypothetical protein n=1 Tax=unclassified Sanguibacter TaxID=2645534 RepID=UPI0032AE857F
MTSDTSDRPLALAGRSKAWRLALVVAVLGVLVSSQFLRSNDFFPFGSLSQYARGTDPNGTVRATKITALTVDGEEQRVPLGARGIGIERAEIEGQLDRIIADPSLLEGVARAYSGMHPEREPLAHVTVVRVSSTLRDGKPSGEEETEEVLAEWTVRGDYGTHDGTSDDSDASTDEEGGS